MASKRFKPGDVVEYNNEAYCVSFVVNNTYHLQKRRSEGSAFVNDVPGSRLKTVSKSRLISLAKKGDTTAKDLLKEIPVVCDEPLSDEETHIIRQMEYERKQKTRTKEIEDRDF